MELHRNAKLGLRGRYELVLAIERGMSLKAAAAAFSVSPATAHRWWHRWRSADQQERGSRVCLYDRSSRPRRCPRMLPGREQARICAVRRRSGWGPRLIAGSARISVYPTGSSDGVVTIAA
jgi:transposase-like protein